jgi:peptidoglycan/LPS O-acetylase OafA/YrhL
MLQFGPLFMHDRASNTLLSPRRPSVWREFQRATGFGIEHPTLASRLEGRCNNFDFIRLAAALLVILSHCYLLHRPRATPIYMEPFRCLTGHDTFGAFAVRVFFIISGLLIARSYLSDPRPLPYLRKRCLRIVPGLGVCVALCAFVMGPLVTNLSFREYLAQPETWRYVRNAVLWPRTEYYLPGVFVTNPDDTVNGSLWSLPLESFMYVAVVALGISALLRRRYVVLAMVALCFLVQIAPAHEALLRVRGGYWIAKLSEFAYFFFAGTLALLFKDLIRLDGRLALIALVTTILSFHTPLAYPIYALALPYLVMYAAFVRIPGLNAAARHGDFSYGVYLYGFPLQQLVLYFHPAVSFTGVFAASAAAAIVAGALSWHGVEKHFLRLKRRTSDHHEPAGCTVTHHSDQAAEAVGAA